MHQRGDASVEADTTIEVATYVWDGEVGSSGVFSATEIHPGNTLTIKGAISNTASGDGYDGEVTIHEDASLVIDRAWQLDGEMNLLGGSVFGGDVTIDACRRSALWMG
jgi:hypothetical protein